MVIVDLTEMNLAGLQTRVAELNADGYRAHIALRGGRPPHGNENYSADTRARTTPSLSRFFSVYQTVCTLRVPAGIDPHTALERLYATRQTPLDESVDAVLLGVRDRLADLPDGFSALDLDAFQTTEAAITLLVQTDTPDHGSGPAVRATPQWAGGDPRELSPEPTGARRFGREPTEGPILPPVRLSASHFSGAGAQEAPSRWKRLRPALFGVVPLAVILAAGLALTLTEPSEPPSPAADAASLEPKDQGTGRADTMPPVSLPLATEAAEAPARLFAQRPLKLYRSPSASSAVVGFVPAQDPVERWIAESRASEAHAPETRENAQPDDWFAVQVPGESVKGYVFAPLLSTRRFDPEKARYIQVQDCTVCPDLVYLRAGSVRLGSAPESPGHRKEEAPRRQVTLMGPRLLGRTEVTRDQWTACVEAKACKTLGGSGDTAGAGRLPVTGVSWPQAQAYVEWLSARTGRPYRLPSEAEWEFAARAGTTTPFYFGARLSPSQANFNAALAGPLSHEGPARPGLQPVATYPVNGFGLADMHGNAGEWVADCWSPDHRQRPTDGKALVWPDCTVRAVRGGTWTEPAAALRSAARRPRQAKEPSPNIGFRVIRGL